MKRTCDQLGLCQNKTPRCNGCIAPHFFAPGVIDHQRTHTPRQLLWRWLRRTFVLMAVVAVAGLLAGYLTGGPN